MKRQKLIAKLEQKGIYTAKDISTVELQRKAAQADRDPAITAPAYRPLPRISTLV